MKGCHWLNESRVWISTSSLWHSPTVCREDATCAKSTLVWCKNIPWLIWTKRVIVKNLQWIYEILFLIGKNHEVLEIQTMFLNYMGCDDVEDSFYSLNRMGWVKVVIFLQLLGLVSRLVFFCLERMKVRQNLALKSDSQKNLRGYCLSHRLVMNFGQLFKHALHHAAGFIN